MTEINLDKIAAERAQQIVKNAAAIRKEDVSKPTETLDRLVTKSLGVLQEQGVYALMLFLFSRSSDEARVAPVVRAELYQALVQIPAYAQNDQQLPENLRTDKPAPVFDYYSSQVLANLDQLLLIRDLYEQILIYARYGAKAHKEG